LVWLKGWWLLRGRRVETFIQGLHMYFLRYAGRPVNGFIGQDQRSITLSGIATYVDAQCRRAGEHQAVLVFQQTD
jgi:hypothetical protein